VDMHVQRFMTPQREVFDISGTLRTPAGVWHFNVDGHSGHGKLDDETVVYMEFDRQHLALTINPYDPPAPTYRFRRA